MNLPKEQIQEIAELLLSGFICFVNKTNGSIESFYRDTDLLTGEEDPWQEVKDKIDKDFTNYIRCEPMDSYQSFSVMKDFTATVESGQLSEKLIHALNRPKPFGNFKYTIDYSGEYRQKWFDFRLEKNIQWVTEQLLE